MNDIFQRVEGLVSSINLTTDIYTRLNDDLLPVLRPKHIEKSNTPIKIAKKVKKVAHFDISYSTNSEEKSLALRIKTLVKHEKNKEDHNENDAKYLDVLSCEMVYDSFYLVNDDVNYLEDDFNDFIRQNIEILINSEYRNLRKQLSYLLRGNGYDTKLPLVLIKRGNTEWD